MSLRYDVWDYQTDKRLPIGQRFTYQYIHKIHKLNILSASILSLIEYPRYISMDII